MRLPRTLNVLALALITCAYLGNDGEACSTHGLVQAATLRADLFGDLNPNGFLNGIIAIQDGFIAPTSSTGCVAGIGLGSTSTPVPNGVSVTTAQVVITNTVTGIYSPLPNFSFSANATTTSAMTNGSGVSTPPGTNPLFVGSQWFGFVAPVDPFTLPTLGRDEVFELLFEIEVPPETLPFSIPVQFAAGEGLTDGSPIFTGSHPVTYFTATDSTASFAAVPEPSSLVVWGLIGLLAALGLFWRRAKKQTPTNCCTGS